MADENRNAVVTGAEDSETKAKRRKMTTEEYFASEKERHRRYLLEFHVEMCNCSLPVCIKAHNAAEQRRPPTLLVASSKWNYFPHKCKQGLACSKQQCSKAHNDDEVKYHPTVYKTKRCSFQTNQEGMCNGLGIHCPFAHSDEDLRIGFRPVEDPSEEEGPKEASKRLRRCTTDVRPQPFPRTDPDLERLQLKGEIERFHLLLTCGNCGQFEKEWLLDCGHMVCRQCCNGRLRQCPICACEVRQLRSVRLK